MGREIERKFKVKGDGWRPAVSKSTQIRQGYIFANDLGNLRVRICDDETAAITIKSGGSLSRAEFEYRVPLSDGRELMELAGERTLEKTRHWVTSGTREWVVDVFGGRHEGLVLAEIELDRQNEIFEHPDWVGKDVSEDPDFSNAALAGAR
jgi:adenylate cyclase